MPMHHDIVAHPMTTRHPYSHNPTPTELLHTSLIYVSHLSVSVDDRLRSSFEQIGDVLTVMRCDIRVTLLSRMARASAAVAAAAACLYCIDLRINPISITWMAD